jgi:hypothetical protein
MIPSIGVLINPLPNGPDAKQEQRLCRDERRVFARFTQERERNMTKSMRRFPQGSIIIIGDLVNPEPGKRLRQAEYELQSRLVSQPVMWR